MTTNPCSCVWPTGCDDCAEYADVLDALMRDDDDYVATAPQVDWAGYEPLTREPVAVDLDRCAVERRVPWMC